MKISQKGLYALQAMMMLARHYNQGAIRIRDIAYEGNVMPQKSTDFYPKVLSGLTMYSMD